MFGYGGKALRMCEDVQVGWLFGMEAGEVRELLQQQMDCWFCGWQLPNDAVLTRSGRLQSDGPKFAGSCGSVRKEPEVVRKKPGGWWHRKGAEVVKVADVGQREGGREGDADI